jgi:Multicopper oxidase
MQKLILVKPLPNGYPWGNVSAQCTNSYDCVPTTGVIRTYNFEISRGFLSPDGFNESVMLISGQFPGPTIEANWGDTIQARLLLSSL